LFREQKRQRRQGRGAKEKERSQHALALELSKGLRLHTKSFGTEINIGAELLKEMGSRVSAGMGL